jgi:hypothetical protein
MVQRYLLASDFDQTLSFNDSGVVLAELVDTASMTKSKGLLKLISCSRARNFLI